MVGREGREPLFGDRSKLLEIDEDRPESIASPVGGTLRGLDGGRTGVGLGHAVDGSASRISCGEEGNRNDAPNQDANG